MDYANAAYQKVLAAAKIGVQVEPQSWQAEYKARRGSDKLVDSVDYQRNKP